MFYEFSWYGQNRGEAVYIVLQMRDFDPADRVVIYVCLLNYYLGLSGFEL